MAAEVQADPHGSLSALWEPHARQYWLYRPDYPTSLLQAVFDFAALPRKILAVDVGAGNGQLTAALAKEFESVLGVDASAGQLAHARRAPNVVYRVAPAEATGVSTAAADLVTAATCIHWFDLPSFYREARRILRPHGALAAWGYFPSSLSFPDCPAASEALQRFCRQRMWPYFHPALQACMERGYTGLEPGAADFGTVRTFNTAMEQSMTLDQVVGWVSSWSCHGPFVAQHGQAVLDCALQELREELRLALSQPLDEAAGGGGRRGSELPDREQRVYRTAIQLEVVFAKEPVPALKLAGAG